MRKFAKMSEGEYGGQKMRVHETTGTVECAGADFYQYSGTLNTEH